MIKTSQTISSRYHFLRTYSQAANSRMGYLYGDVYAQSITIKLECTEPYVSQPYVEYVTQTLISPSGNHQIPLQAFHVYTQWLNLHS